MPYCVFPIFGLISLKKMLKPPPTQQKNMICFLPQGFMILNIACWVRTVRRWNLPKQIDPSYILYLHLVDSYGKCRQIYQSHGSVMGKKDLFLLATGKINVSPLKVESRLWFQTFLIFTPILGELIQFDEHIFQMGWFNHQLHTNCLFETCFFALPGHSNLSDVNPYMCLFLLVRFDGSEILWAPVERMRISHVLIGLDI